MSAVVVEVFHDVLIPPCLLDDIVNSIAVDTHSNTLKYIA